ncbi:MAG TPA: energy-coupling factor transporter transmembrane component T [Methanocella sp.]|jgi:energy-coupling factor transport system permease protein
MSDRHRGGGKKRRGGKAREKLRYLPGESFIHRLDPRTKIFLLMAFTIAALLTVNPVLNLALLSILLALAFLSGAFRHWSRLLWKVAPLLAIIVIFDSLFSHVGWGPTLFEANRWILHILVTPGSIVYAITIGMRFLTIVGMSFLFIMTTQFEDFVAGLRKLHVPYVIALSLGLAFRSITLLSADLRAITDAQRSRCMELDARSILQGVDRLLPLAVPATVCLIYRSRNVSSAMLCRGYGHAGPPTLYSRLRLAPADWAIFACLSCGAIVLVFLNLIKL